jgi:hypothetical protein
MSKRAKGKHYPIEISAVAWLDLLGYGSMLREVSFDPSHELAQSAVTRLRAYQQTAAKAAMRRLQALIVNDGVAYVRQLSPRAASVGFDFLIRVYSAYKEINALDQSSGYPGARMIVAVGPRIRIEGVSKPRLGHLSSILNRFANGILSPEQAIREAFRSTPVTGGIEELQANFAFSKAYLADSDGSRAGFKGPKCFVDATFFSSCPSWLRVSKSIKWSTPGLKSLFFELVDIDRAKAGKVNYAGLRDALEVANVLGISYYSVFHKQCLSVIQKQAR